MKVSTRTFVRDFAAFRAQAERGESVVIETREGTKFVFRRIGTAVKPRQVDMPLPKRMTDRWNVEGAATPAEEWGMNR